MIRQSTRLGLVISSKAESCVVRTEMPRFTGIFYEDHYSIIWNCSAFRYIHIFCFFNTIMVLMIIDLYRKLCPLTACLMQILRICQTAYSCFYYGCLICQIQFIVNSTWCYRYVCNQIITLVLNVCFYRVAIS